MWGLSIMSDICPTLAVYLSEISTMTAVGRRLGWGGGLPYPPTKKTRRTAADVKHVVVIVWLPCA